MPKRKSMWIAAAGFLALTGAASAMPISQPSAGVQAETDLRQAAWQCFQFGNCVWRPDSNFYPPYYGNGYKAPPRRYHRPRTYR